MHLRPLLSLLGLALLAGCDPDIEVDVLDTSEECAALLPKPPLRPVLASYPVEAPERCGAARTNDKGNLLLHVPASAAFTTQHWVVFHPRSSSWSGGGGGAGAGMVVPQYGGYVGLRAREGEPPRLVFEPGGTLHRLRVLPDAYARTELRSTLEDLPKLGVLWVASGNLPSGGYSLTADFFGPSGRHMAGTRILASATSGSAPTRFAVAADLRQVGLVVWETPKGFHARSVAGDTFPLGPELVLPGVAAGSDFAVQALLEGPFVIKIGGTWRFQVVSESRLEAPPAWLVASGDTRLASIRNDTGYAVLPPAGIRSATCSQKVQVRTPSGRLCGTVTLRQGRGPCTTAALTVGRDGSLVERMARDACTGEGCACTHRVWWGMLR